MQRKWAPFHSRKEPWRFFLFKGEGRKKFSEAVLAWERKIGVVWKTNEYNWDPDFRQSIGVKPGEKIVSTLHMGYFDEGKVPRPKPRTPVSELLTLFE